MAEIGEYVRIELEDGEAYEGEVVKKDWQGFVEGHRVELKYKHELGTGNVIIPVSEISRWEKIRREFESGQLSFFEIQMVLCF